MYSSKTWAWAALAWIGVIFFSSTSLALKWAEAGFGFFSNEFLQSLKASETSYNLVHLFADKGFHVSLFFVLAILLWRALGPDAGKSWQILAAGAVVGSLSEFLQRFFPDRDPALRDVLINTFGTALGVALCLAAARMRSGTRSEVASSV